MQKNTWQKPTPITDKSSQKLAKEGHALKQITEFLAW